MGTLVREKQSDANVVACFFDFINQRCHCSGRLARLRSIPLSIHPSIKKGNCGLLVREKNKSDANFVACFSKTKGAIAASKASASPTVAPQVLVLIYIIYADTPDMR